MNFFGRYILGGLLPVILIGLGVYFLFLLRFFFIAKPGKFFSSLTNKGKGQGTSSFGALTVALAGTLGVGNIVGVASSIILGGAGSVFWMIVSAFAAMVLKYAEIVLAHRHRRISEGVIRGGAMYYIEDFIGGTLGKVLGGIFAIFCIVNSISMGCMLQSNAVAVSFGEISEVSAVLIGAVLAVICGAVIIKGVHDISPLTSVIIPLMTVLYVGMSAAVIWFYRDSISGVVSLIFDDAFSYRSISGGFFGFFLSNQLRYGCMRGLLSNEAGCGTAPMAHASSRAEKAAEQGIWGIIEVFVDTVLLCTLTAFSILLVFGESAYEFESGEEMKLIIAAYGAVFGKSSALLMTVMVFFFAFATIICWAYYADVTLGYLTSSKLAANIFKIVYIICIFIGSCHISDAIWTVSDIALCFMTLINLIILFLMRKEIKFETELL